VAQAVQTTKRDGMAAAGPGGAGAAVLTGRRAAGPDRPTAPVTAAAASSARLTPTRPRRRHLRRCRCRASLISAWVPRGEEPAPGCGSPTVTRPAVITAVPR
jgi:hypothetical protein